MEIDGEQLAGRLRGRQVPLLLAYLVLNRDRQVGREELIGALWPGQAPLSQDAALRTLLSRLRSALGADSLAGREEISLTLPEPVWIDLEAAALELERASATLEAGQYRGAWALAQIPLNIAARGLLPGISASWLEPPRRELEEVRLRGLEVLGRAGLRLGGRQLASVQRAGRTLIDAEPYRESGYVLLMEALAAEGNVAEGLRVFERLRSLLRDELGTTPSADTLELHSRLLGPGDPSPPRPGAEETALALPAELRLHASGPFIGRRRELAELRSEWALGVRQRPERERRRLVLLAGDAGVGKTRLIAEVASLAHGEGAIVLAGRAPQEALAPYQPFVEALHQYVLGAELEALRRHTREYAADLAALAPELARRMPELTRRAASEELSERYRLFEAFVGVLTEISRTTPLLLVLDDLHWADRTTLLLLRHVARAPTLSRVLVLGAYRSTEVPGEGFAGALAELRRERLVSELALGGLDETEVAELVRALTDAHPSAPLRRALHERTEGNPLFVEAIVRHLSDAGVDLARGGASELRRVGLPQGVRDVIAGRLHRLDADALEVLRCAAVIGRDFDLRLLESVVSLDEERFLLALDAALAAGLVNEVSSRSGSAAFSHALIRETLYEGLSAARAERLHRRVAAALEQDGGDDERRLPALALHFTRAAEPSTFPKAIEYATRAAEQATRVLAHDEAVGHLASALEVLERFDHAADGRRCELLLALGEAEIRAGERPAASASLRRAAALATQLGDDAALVRAVIGASDRYVQQPGVEDQELIALIEQALATPAGAEPATRVRLLSRLCGALYYTSGGARLGGLAAEALAIADGLAVPVAHADAWSAACRARWNAEQLPERTVAATEMLTAARRARNLELELQAHAWLVVSLLERGDIDAVDAQIAAFAAGAERIRQPLYLWNATVWRAMRAQLSGRLTEAEQLATAALAMGARAEPVTAPQWFAIQLFAIRSEQLRLGELRDAVRRVVAEHPRMPAWRAVHARMLTEVGELDAARRELDALVENDFALLSPDGNWLAALTILAEVGAALGEPSRIELIYARLAPFAGRIATVGLATVCLGSVERSLGALAAAAGERVAAIAHLERALVANAAIGAAGWLAHCQVELAELLGAGDPRAAELWAAAGAAAGGLELPALARRLRAAV